MSLQVKDIKKTFGKGPSETPVLKGINFEVNDGEFVILMVHQAQVRQHYLLF